MAREAVSHIGRVIAVTPSVTTVSIAASSACGTCHAAGLCGMGAYTEKAIEVPTDLRHPCAVGDEVEVVLEASMGLKAVWISYVVPLLVLLAVILVLAGIGAGEVVTGLAAIGAVGLYYFGVWLLRDRLRDEYVFTIKR